MPSPGPPLGADLSTIIEAENSGISKHIPCVDDSTHPDSQASPPESPFCLDEHDEYRFSPPDSRNGSVLGLSTSRLNAEVMDALMVKDAVAATEWLKGVDGVVVEEGADEPQGIPGLGGEVDPHATFDNGALDPSLAQLLSPHRLNGKSHCSSPTSHLRPRTHPRSPNHHLRPFLSPLVRNTKRRQIHPKLALSSLPHPCLVPLRSRHPRDGEFHYPGHPFPVLQHRHSHVLHVRCQLRRQQRIRHRSPLVQQLPMERQRNVTNLLLHYPHKHIQLMPCCQQILVRPLICLQDDHLVLVWGIATPHHTHPVAPGRISNAHRATNRRLQAPRVRPEPCPTTINKRQPDRVSI